MPRTPPPEPNREDREKARNTELPPQRNRSDDEVIPDPLDDDDDD